MRSEFLLSVHDMRKMACTQHCKQMQKGLVRLAFVKSHFFRNMQLSYTFFYVCQYCSPAKYFVKLRGNVLEHAVIQNV